MFVGLPQIWNCFKVVLFQSHHLACCDCKYAWSAGQLSCASVKVEFRNLKAARLTSLYISEKATKKEETSCLCCALNIQSVAFYSFPSAACTWHDSRYWTSREQRGCWNCSELLSEVIAGIWKLHSHTPKPCTLLINLSESKFRVGWNGSENVLKRPMIEVHQGQFAGFALAHSGHQSGAKGNDNAAKQSLNSKSSEVKVVVCRPYCVYCSPTSVLSLTLYNFIEFFCDLCHIHFLGVGTKRKYLSVCGEIKRKEKRAFECCRCEI